jgi:hypothetical protein
MGEFKPTADPERGRRTSRELTAARTALGAVRRALEELAHVEQHSSTRDPEFSNIRFDLVAAQGVLWKYRRTGRPRKAQEWTS